MKTTKKDFDLFKEECIKWQSKLGLTDYRLYFRHEDLKESNATCNCGDGDAFHAVLTLSHEIMNEHYPHKTFIRQVAFHEMCHVLLHRLRYIATCRYCQPEEINDAEHQIIRRLEHLFFSSQ